LAKNILPLSWDLLDLERSLNGSVIVDKARVLDRSPLLLDHDASLGQVLAVLVHSSVLRLQLHQLFILSQFINLLLGREDGSFGHVVFSGGRGVISFILGLGGSGSAVQADHEYHYE